MNPYKPFLYIVPIIFSILAGLSKTKKIQLCFVGIATLFYWGILQFYVEYSYNHPFNPNDGGPKTFALLFGWLLGLCLLILPIYYCTLGVKRLIQNRKLKTLK